MMRLWFACIWIMAAAVTCGFTTTGHSEDTAALQQSADTGAADEAALSALLNQNQPPAAKPVQENPVAKVSVPDSSFIKSFVRLLLSLGLVIVLIYGSGILLKRFYGRRSHNHSKEALIQVVDRALLDNKKSIYLIKVADRLLIVGSGTNEMQLLSTIKDQSVVDSIKTTDFSYHLKDFVTRFGKNRVRENVEA